MNIPVKRPAMWMKVAALAAAMLVSTLLHAANEAIPPMKLSEALSKFSRTSGIQVVYVATIAKGLRTKGVPAGLSTDETLKALLQGTGLSYRFVNPHTVTIKTEQEMKEAAGASAMDQMKLASAQHATADRDEESSVSDDSELVVTAHKVEGLSAMRVPTTLREIPQSISVVDQDTIQQQNAQSLADVLNRATGISMVSADTMHASYIARGFSVTKFHIDGGSPISLGGSVSISPTDLAQFDHVEILRGADGLFGGNGNPGATVSLVRKRPGMRSTIMTTASYGSWGNYRLEADVSGPIASDSGLRGRAVVVKDGGDYFFDTAKSRRDKYYGILEYDVVPDSTVLTVGGSLEQSHQVPTSGGLPRFDNGADPGFSRSTAITVPWAYFDTRTWEGFAQLDHEFNDSWKVKVSGTLLRQSSNGRYITTTSSINPVSRLMDGLLVIPTNYHESDQSSLDVTLTGSFEWLGRRHEVLVGADYGSMHDVTSSITFLSFGPPIDPFSFDPGAYSAPVDDPNDPNDDPFGPGGDDIIISQYGGYAAVRLRPLAKLAVIGGMRYSAIDYSTAQTSQIQLDNQYSGKITPYAGVVYDLSQNYSVYASYADIFEGNPNGLIGSPGGAPLPPSDGINLETGLKAAWFEGRLNGSLALFKIDQDGVPFRRIVPGSSFPCCYEGATNRSRGAETEISGTLTPNWIMTAGYTYNRKNTNTSGGVLSTRTPRHLFKLWTSYQLPGNLRAWNVGGGLNAQSSNYIGGSGCTQFDALGDCIGPFVRFDIEQGAYAVATVRIAYDVNPKWSMALNVNNVTDKTYFQTVGGTTGANSYGEPRNFLLKLSGRF